MQYIYKYISLRFVRDTDEFEKYINLLNFINENAYLTLMWFMYRFRSTFAAAVPKMYGLSI